jgi:cardiolipin synthase
MDLGWLGEPSWLLIPFVVIGVIAALYWIITLFSAVGRRPDRMWTEEIGAVDSPDFMRPVAALLSVPIRKGGTVELLNNGDAWLSRLLPDMRAAQQSITFSAYMWHPGRLSDAIFEVLEEKARQGLQARVLLDGLGGMKCPAESVDRLRAAGGRVDRFRPLKFGKVFRFHRRNHRRAIVIDGRIGYTGGMAVVDHWLGDARNPDEWRDTMVRVTGCIAESVQSAFAELWAYVTGEVMTGEAVFPEDFGEPSDIRSMGVVSSPASEQAPLRLLFFLSLLAARERLWINTPYFVPDKHTRRVIAGRARAGVDVRLMVPNRHNDIPAVRRASHGYYQRLLDAGVRIFEYQPTMIHSKHVVVDGKWSIVGSANLDIRSKELNQENVIGILDPGLAGQIEQAFLRDQEQCVEFTSAEWRKRGLAQRVLERTAGFFTEQY